MKKPLAIAIALIISTIPFASAQNRVSMEESFDAIFNAFLTPAAEAGTNVGGWDDIANIKGIQWQWPRNQIAEHHYTWKGTMGDNAEVEIQGTRTLISQASISFAINPSYTKSVDIDHFNPDQLTKIPTTCDNDGAMHQEAFYRWTKPGHTPLYIHYMFSFGTHMGNVDYNIGYYLEDILNPYPNPCKVISIYSMEEFFDSIFAAFIVPADDFYSNGWGSLTI